MVIILGVTHRCICDLNVRHVCQRSETEGVECVPDARRTSHVTHVTRHMSHVTRHTSHVTRHTRHTSHVTHVTRHTSHTSHVTHVTRHTSHVTHVTHVTRDASHVTRHSSRVTPQFEQTTSIKTTEGGTAASSILCNRTLTAPAAGSLVRPKSNSAVKP